MCSLCEEFLDSHAGGATRAAVVPRDSARRSRPVRRPTRLASAIRRDASARRKHRDGRRAPR
jgi:hypothetical protein